MIQNIEEQCGGIFIADIYMKIFKDNVLNNFDKYTFYFFSSFFSQMLVKYLQINKKVSPWY